MSDNGPQYDSHEFAAFAKSYSFCHTTSSPHFPQSNGHAERAVQTMKKLLKGAEDPYLALLTYWSTPLPWCGLSPAELLMGRQIRSNLPQLSETLTPHWPFLQKFRASDEEFKNKQKVNFDKRHRTKPLPEIPDNTDVWITTDGSHSPGRVTAPANAPRSYLVETQHGQVRRNRTQLNIVPDTHQARSDHTSDPLTPRSPIMTRSRTGTHVAPPDHLHI